MPVQRNRLQQLLKSIEVLQAPENVQIPLGIEVPDKDKPILLAALAGKASHLLTGDFRHFGRYYGQKIEGILILPPARYK